MCSLTTLPARLILGIVAAGVLVAGGASYRRHVYQQGYAAAVAERAQTDVVAILRRTQDNAVLAIQQAQINTIITEKKHEELAPVRERILTQRVYVGSAVCGDRAAATAEAEGTGSGNEADPSRRVVRPDVERDLVALKLAVEEDLATGRACQGTLRENGLAP
jgi:hypothetical protein